MERLTELGAALEPVLPLLEDKPLCVYATGSYGRLEAWEGSDVDLFFLYDGAPSDPFPWTNFVRVAACLMDATQRMGFPTVFWRWAVPRGSVRGSDGEGAGKP